MGTIRMDPAFVPASVEDWRACLSDPYWRIYSGQLYKIMVKSDADDTGFVMPFRPNAVQTLFLESLHYRNVILKARQLGLTTVACIMWLDHALWVPDQRCGVIAHTKTSAETLFRDKVKFAYENLPPPLKARFPLKRDAAEELLFAHNNSSIRVDTSMRSGTLHRLHVSELGKIAVQSRSRAREVVTGSIPALADDGVLIVESTAEGAAGEFYDMCQGAQAIAETARMPTRKEFMFHFFPWQSDAAYVADPAYVTISATEHEYFDNVQREMGCKITLPQRAWYVATRDGTMGGDPEKMWQEYPSTPEECWQKSTEGTYYPRQLSAARSQGRIRRVPHVENVPVHTFWDIGAGDGTGIWLMQYVGSEHRFIRYIEGWGESYAFYVKALRETGYVFGIHHLPHDANHMRQMANTVASPLNMLMELAPDWNFEIIPPVQTLQAGIEMTRQKFGQAVFDTEGCKHGLVHLSLYRKTWNRAQAAWTETPNKLEGHSEAADAFRQWAQGFDPRRLSNLNRRPSATRRPTGLTA